MTDDELVEAVSRLSMLILSHQLELEVGFDFRGWQIRVRGYDPVGALHEDGFVEHDSMIQSMLTAVETFCVRYGIPT